jgi:hypothetical protein
MPGPRAGSLPHAAESEKALVRDVVLAYWAAALPLGTADLDAGFEASWAQVADDPAGSLAEGVRSGLPVDDAELLLSTVVCAALALVREARQAATMEEVSDRLRRAEVRLWDLTGAPDLVSELRELVERHVRSARATAPAVPRESLPPEDPALRPDLEWVVRLDRQENRLEYLLSAADQNLKLAYRSFASPPLRGQQTADYFQALYAQIDHILGGGVRDLLRLSGGDRGVAEWKLAGIGVSLAHLLLPDELRELLRSLRGRVQTLWILSDEPWVPWEVLGIGAAGAADAVFLGEAFDLCRWPLGSRERIQFSLRFPLRRVALVQPRDSNLRFLRPEREALSALLGDRLREIPAAFPEVRDALADGRFDGWHFCGHGIAQGNQPDGWGLVLEGGIELSPHDLRAFAGSLQSSPLVILNACHSALRAESLTGLGGLAQQFLEAGAGAVLGAQFAVGDEPAAAFSDCFFRHFLAGAPLGKAMRKGRTELRERFPGDPAWLAYAAFAHPLARHDPGG